MMSFIKPFTIIWMLYAHVVFTIGAAAFSGNFELSSLDLQCPSEIDTASIVGSALSFDFSDQDTPNNPAVHCCLEWAAGQQPPSLPKQGTCSDGNVTAYVPDGRYYGFANMTLKITHQYEDDSLGPYPYNVLTKYASLQLDYQNTPDYECNMDTGSCELSEGATITAIVTEATG